jgi:acetyl-CoA acetyltransferase
MKKIGLKTGGDLKRTWHWTGKLRDQGLIELEKKNMDRMIQHSVPVYEVIMGNDLQSRPGPNTARQAMIQAGYPINRAATLTRFALTGLKAITLRNQHHAVC